MKHRTRKLLALLLALCLLAAALPLSASAAQYSGSCGQNLTWSIDGNVLAISGSGPMNDYIRTSDQPWYKYRKPVTKVVVNSGVTTIGKDGFRTWNLTLGEEPVMNVKTEATAAALRRSGYGQEILLNGVPYTLEGDILTVNNSDDSALVLERMDTSGMEINW